MRLLLESEKTSKIIPDRFSIFTISQERKKTTWGFD